MKTKIKLLIGAQLKIGTIGFGGPLAAISLMKKEFVDDRALLDSKKFIEGLAFVKLLPGPVSTLLSIFIGQEIAGFWGGLFSGLAYLLPSFLMILAISNFEGLIMNSPLGHMGLSLAPLMATILGMIVFTCYKLFRESLDLAIDTGPTQAIFSVLVFVLAASLAFLGFNEFLLLMSCGFSGIFFNQFMLKRARMNVALLPMFLVFFWASFSVFGTGYMILPVLEKVLVAERHWVDGAAFLRAMTYGNLTPGPIVITSTALGFMMAGNLGAVIATLGIFLPPFLIILLLGHSLKKILLKPWSRGFVDGVIPAVSASILMSLVPLSRGLQWGSVTMSGVFLGFMLSYRKITAWKIILLGFVLIGVQKFYGLAIIG